MSQLDFTIFIIHYFDIVTVFYILICYILFVLVGRSINNGARKKG